MNETAQPRTQQEIIDDVASGKLERGELKIKEVARIDKFEMTDDGRKLVETITMENGVVVSREQPPS